MTPELSLRDRVIAVAGAGGGGIGTAISVMLAKAGAVVAAIDRSASGRALVEKELGVVGGRFLVIDADLSGQAAVSSAVNRIERDLGPIQGLVNVVGGFERQDQLSSLLAPAAAEIFDDVMRFNVRPTLLMSIECARLMAVRGCGSIIHITSSTGIVSMPFGAGYAAGKAALINLTRTMAVEWGALGIRVNSVACGTILTAEARRFASGVEQAAKEVVPLGRCGEPEEIAGPVLFLLSDLASYVNGAILSVDGGALARAPYNDSDNLPVFINDPDLKARLLKPGAPPK
jgi:NAD(P)-dependent dehydrogenase (short-subunit alcohol dehydrogenase family)